MPMPKIIHYCWLSGEPYPELVQRCMQSWKEKLPDYEFMLWDMNRFDIHSVPWVEQACAAKKWAFAADYIRLYALYNYGGIYLDSDVEVLKSFDDLLELPYFFGREHYFDMIDFRFLRDNSLEIFPMDYFSPKNTRTLVLETTENTYSIHHFNGSWHSFAQQKHVALRTKLCKVFGERLGEILTSFLAIFINIRYEGLGNTLKKISSKI